MSDSGRFYYTAKNGRTFCVEPIDNSAGKGRAAWGDLNPATGKIEGDYGSKNRGSVTESESIITKENGYDDIHYTGIGVSPIKYIDWLVAKEMRESKESANI